MRRMMWAPVLGALLAIGMAAGAQAAPRHPAADPAPAGGVLRVTGDTHLILSYDPAGGQRNGRYTTPWNVFNNTEDIAFSWDRRYVAVVTDIGNLEIGKFTGEGWQSVRSYTRADLAEQDRDGTYGTPRFTSDGNRLMFSVWRETSQSPHDVIAAYSLDAANPAAKPIRDAEAAEYWDTAGTPVHAAGVQAITGVPSIDGKPVKASLLVSSDEVVAATVFGVDDSDFQPYTCNEPLDNVSLVCMADQSISTPAQGTIAILTLLPDGTLTLTKRVGALPSHAALPDPELGQDVYLSPDRTRMLVKTPRGWYAGDVDGSPAPKYQFPHLGAQPVHAGERVAGWGPRHYLPAHHID
ncbi:MAG: hypothetical protein WCA46_15120 [Actinocatenispora sp.]